MVTIFFLGDLTAQKEDFIWQLGYKTNKLNGTRMDFNRMPVKVTGRNGGAIDMDITNTAISNSEGDLLFYTNGSFIYDRRDQLMQNGDTLSPNNESVKLISEKYGQRVKQGVLILPWPGRDNLYCLLHNYWFRDDSLTTEVQHYSIVDMRKNNGYGAVVKKNQVLFQDPALTHGRLTACRHANGRDWWILIRRNYGYYRFLLNPAGLHSKGIQQIGPEVGDGGVGQAGFSPDGAHYVYLSTYVQSDPHFLDIYNFNRCTGKLYNHRRIQYQPAADFSGRGLAFSPNSRYLYVSSSYYMRQVDMQDTNLQESMMIVKVAEEVYCPPTFPLIYHHLQLAPDGRIYISGGGTHCHLSTIRYPDRKGSDCEVESATLRLKTRNFRSLPDFPHFRLGPLDGSACDTLGIERPPLARFRSSELDTAADYTIRFTDISWYHPTDWEWSFGDGQTDTIQHPDHTYQDTGRYEVCLNVINEDGQDTHCDTVHITDDATDVSIPDQEGHTLTVYPVPAHEEITISGLEPGTNCFIFNLQGQQIDAFRVNQSKLSYDIGSLKPGMYWIKTRQQTAKFIRME